MTASTARLLTLACLATSSTALHACLGIGQDPEGTNAGECSDGADNDQDDLWDCEDPDCDGSPDCFCWDYPYDDFEDDLQQTVCDKVAECGMFSEHFTYEDCMAPYEDDGWVCVDYDCEAADACDAGWAAIACDAIASGQAVDVCTAVCSND